MDFLMLILESLVNISYKFKYVKILIGYVKLVVSAIDLIGYWWRLVTTANFPAYFPLKRTLSIRWSNTLSNAKVLEKLQINKSPGKRYMDY